MSAPDLGLLLLLALILGVLWEWRRDRAGRRRTEVERSLRSGDPDEVEAALAAIRRLGLADHADNLLNLVDSEPTPEVRRSVVNLVAGQQWEPVTSTSVRRLRDWAASEAQRVRATEPSTRTPTPTPTSDIETGLARRVEQALDEPLTWLSAETPDGDLVVDRPDKERDQWD